MNSQRKRNRHSHGNNSSNCIDTDGNISHSGRKSTAGKRKRKRIIIPQRHSESESLELVASPLGPIATPTISVLDKDILLDRLRVELVSKYKFTLSPLTKGDGSDGKKRRNGGTKDSISIGGIQSKLKPNCKQQRERKVEEISDETDAVTAAKAVVKKRLVAGTNQCTRILEAAVLKTGPVPSLILLARDVRPPTILAHLPFLCRQLGVPILLLPGKASSDLGRVLGTKTVSVLLFCPMPTKPLNYEPPEHTLNHHIHICHQRIDSYVHFARSKVPSS